jgi:hypothetical protein
MTAAAIFWTWPLEHRAVLELGDGETAVELALFYDEDGSTRAVWMLSQPHCLLAWAAVGVA